MVEITRWSKREGNCFATQLIDLTNIGDDEISSDEISSNKIVHTRTNNEGDDADFDEDDTSI